MYTLNHYPKNYEYSNDTESLNFIIIKALRFLFSSRRIIHTLSFFLLRLSRFTSPQKVQKYENIYNIPKSHFPWKKCGYCAQVYSINSSLFYWSFFFFLLDEHICGDWSTCWYWFVFFILASKCVVWWHFCTISQSPIFGNIFNTYLNKIFLIISCWFKLQWFF